MTCDLGASGGMAMDHTGMMVSGVGAMQSMNGASQPGNLNLEQTMANTKEKTPMCLVNELARYNKVGIYSLQMY